jgi:hypothetical protein
MQREVAAAAVVALEPVQAAGPERVRVPGLESVAAAVVPMVLAMARGRVPA